MDNAALQATIQEDWENRQLIEGISLGIRDMTEFLNKFDGQARFMLSRLDERLNALERKMAYLESRIVTVVPN